MQNIKITLPSPAKTLQEKGNSATFEIDNLYPGYGHTLGNSLRRIILSSLPGAAITQVKIEGVDHEFSTIDGIKEDVITILLHLKKLRFKLLTDEAQTVTLDVKGPKTVTAKDLELPGQVELLNPDEHIAEITGKTELKMELKVEKGLGFVPKEVLRKDKVEIGTIVPDAIFSPIRRVNYEVENMRVGDRTDFNRLRIFIETDGSISPKEALETAVKIMIKQLNAVVGVDTDDNLPESKEAENVSSDTSEQNEEPDTESMKILVSELKLSARTESALEDAGIRTVGGLVKKTEKDILELPGLGQKALEEITEALAQLNLSLKS